MSIIEIDSLKAFEILKLKENSILIDVRTSFEWNTVGVPDLSLFNKDPIFIEWPTIMDSNFFNNFKDELDKNFFKCDNLIFICKSGVRSRMAAKMSIDFGYKNIFNVLDGFEGNNLSFKGWLNNKLPWKKINF